MLLMIIMGIIVQGIALGKLNIISLITIRGSLIPQCNDRTVHVPLPLKQTDYIITSTDLAGIIRLLTQFNSPCYSI